MLRGLRPGVKNAVVDLSIAYAIGKVTDDIAETPIRAIVATMSDAAVANAARYFGLGASAVFLVTRHGRDVNLPSICPNPDRLWPTRRTDRAPKRVRLTQDPPSWQ